MRGRPVARACLACAAIGLGLLLAGPALAIALDLPGTARQTTGDETNPGSYALPLGPYLDSRLPTLVTEGRVTRQAWRVDARGITTLQLLSPLREQLGAAGFDTLFECHATACGGFDFRFGTEVIAAPDMHVDLYDYRFVSAIRDLDGTGDGAPEYISLLVSRSANAGYIQIIQTTAPDSEPLIANATSGVGAGADTGVTRHPATTLPAPDRAGLIAQLETRGHVVLSDLAFDTGSSDLGKGPFASLTELAGFLLANPTRRIALVGHTDAVGALDGNITLSKRRAASVLDRLVKAHGVPRGQMDAQGMGYLAPITTNLTAQGREANRRVEAILLNTD